MLIGLGAAPGSKDDDREWLLPLVDVMRSITAGFRMASAGDMREEEPETWASTIGWTGLCGASVLPSMLRASSLIARFESTSRSTVVTLSKLAFPDGLGLGMASSGLLILLRPVVLLGSSSRIVMPRAPSVSMKPCTVTGAIAAFAVDGTAVFAILGRLWALVAGDLRAAAIDADDALEDCGAVAGCDSVARVPGEDMLGV